MQNMYILLCHKTEIIHWQEQLKVQFKDFSSDKTKSAYQKRLASKCYCLVALHINVQQQIRWNTTARDDIFISIVFVQH